MREEQNRVESESNVLLELGMRVQEQSVRLAKEHQALSTQQQEIARAKIEIAAEQQKLEQKCMKIKESQEEIRIGRQQHRDIRLKLAQKRKEIAEERAHYGSSSDWLISPAYEEEKHSSISGNASSIVQMALKACQFGGDGSYIKTPQPPRVLEVSDIYTRQDFD